MAQFFASQVLVPVAEDSPCGENPEYGEAFQRLEILLQGREESQFDVGEDPNWQEVEEAARAVLVDARELRSLGFLAKAFLSKGDWSGFAEAMKAIHGLLDGFWECVHPQLDPSDGDPTERINAVEGLAHPDMLLGALRKAPLLKSREVGQFSSRDIAVALGKMTPLEGDAVPDMGLINAAARSIDTASLETLSGQVTAAKEALEGIGRIFAERLSASDVPVLDELVQLLEIDRSFLSAFLPQTAAPEAGGLGEQGSGTIAGQAAPPQAAGDIRSREDVVRQIDRICEFYARNEPSSPVPVLLRRARGLVHKGFADILADLVPGAASQFAVFAGSEEGGGTEATGSGQSSNGW